MKKGRCRLQFVKPGLPHPHPESLVRGTAHPGSKLTESQVVDILNLRGLIPKKALATRYGVSEATIHDICKRKIWKHVDASACLGSRRQEVA